MLYQFEALSGLNIRGDIRKRDILVGVELFRGTIADAYQLHGGNRSIVVVSDDQTASITTAMLHGFDNN